MLNLNEKDVQKLIADYPWLLDIDYEVVPELKNKGMEYVLSDNKRADLILRDRISRRPVIIEFKAVPFYRENIGQILEYKARIISEYTNDNSILKEVFGDKIFVPIMILVVPSCTDEAKLACNLSGIEIYEYEKAMQQLLVPEKIVTLEEFKKDIDNKEIPFTMDRSQLVDRVYNDIKDVLSKENLFEGWTQYKKPSGEYFAAFNHLFVNKYLFQNQRISMGVYEDIFNKDDHNKVVIEYYSANKETLEKFVEKYRELNLAPANEDNNLRKDKFEEYYWTFSVDKNDFFSKTKEIIKPYVKNYENIMKNYLKLYE